MADQTPKITTEGQHAQPKSTKDTTDRFVFPWRTAGLTTGARTINDMIVALQNATDALHLLKEAGVVLDGGTAAGDDALLVTTDPAVAQRFGFQAEEARQEAQAEVSLCDTTDAKAGE